MSDPKRRNIIDTICAELEPLNNAGVEITADTDIATELNLDSVKVMDLIFALEEAYDVSIPMNDLADITRVRELAALVEYYLEDA
jgi:acyl carrier protein